MLNRDQLANVAQETLDIVKKGQYQNGKGESVCIKESVKKAVKETTLYSPKDTNDLLLRVKPENKFETIFEVKNETTLQGAKRLLDEGYEHVAALNFASAKNPGGGFLKGSKAQEESLARSSALYDTIHPKQEMYEYNRKLPTALYSDYLIHSKDVPVFRDDAHDYALLDTPYLCSFITSPAVNAGAVRKNEQLPNQKRIPDVMKKRIEKIIATAVYHGHDAIVLGAFGCGVFKNNPQNIARYFKEVLSDPKYKGKFKKIVFSVLDNDPSKSVISPFYQNFGK